MDIHSESVNVIMGFVEVFRRIMFVLLRVENESLNNPEIFRKYEPVPELNREVEVEMQSKMQVEIVESDKKR